jgi:hypothetical protein
VPEKAPLGVARHLFEWPNRTPRALIGTFSEHNRGEDERSTGPNYPAYKIAFSLPIVTIRVPILL